MVLNSTIRAGLSPRRTFKLVPDVRFGAELAANFSRFLFIGLTNGADLSGFVPDLVVRRLLALAQMRHYPRVSVAYLVI